MAEPSATVGRAAISRSVSSSPAARRNCPVAAWVVVPAPEEACEAAPGRSSAYRTNSAGTQAGRKGQETRVESRAGSKGIRGQRCGAMDKGPVVAIDAVSPSGSDFAAASAPINPLEPAGFSATIVRGEAGPVRSARMRAATSVEPQATRPVAAMVAPEREGRCWAGVGFAGRGSAPGEGPA